jgi:hypothetical protein
MSDPQVKSAAFRQAVLKSERLRILIVLGSVGVVFMVQTIRAVIVQNREDLDSWLLSSLVVALFVGYELLMLDALKRATHADRDLPVFVWVGSSILETSLQALGVCIHNELSGSGCRSGVGEPRRPRVLPVRYSVDTTFESVGLQALWIRSGGHLPRGGVSFGVETCAERRDHHVLTPEGGGELRHRISYRRGCGRYGGG